MTYTPRTRDELARRVLGAIVTRSRLNDTQQGSVIDTLAQAIGAIAAGAEQRLASIRDAFDFRNANGAELEERLSELPPHTIERKGAQRARGVVGVVLEEGLLNPLVIPEGVTFSRSDNGAVYASLEQVTVAAGVRLAVLNVEAATAGVGGNAPSSTIDRIEEAPAEIIAVTNGQAISTGQDAESDASLKRRALLYLQGLARCQPSAIEFAALSVDLPLRLIVADLYELPRTQGMSELYIEDGSGTLNNQRTAGRISQLTVPAGGVRVLYHDAPAVAEVVPTVVAGGVRTPLDRDLYVSIPERGIIYLDEGAVVEGDVLQTAPYEVYTGPIATVQRLIEGDPNDPGASQGYRAAGTRVRVLSPAVVRVSLDLQVTTESGIDSADLESRITENLTALTSELRVGAPFYAAAAIDVVMDLEGVVNVHLFNTGTSDRFTDLYPPAGSVVRINQLNIRPFLEN